MPPKVPRTFLALVLACLVGNLATLILAFSNQENIPFVAGLGTAVFFLASTLSLFIAQIRVSKANNISLHLLWFYLLHPLLSAGLCVYKLKTHPSA